MPRRAISTRAIWCWCGPTNTSPGAATRARPIRRVSSRRSSAAEASFRHRYLPPHVRMKLAKVIEGARLGDLEAGALLRRQHHVERLVGRRGGVGEDVLVVPDDGVAGLGGDLGRREHQILDLHLD